MAHWRFENDFDDETTQHPGTPYGAPAPGAADFLGPVARDPVPETQESNSTALELNRADAQWVEVPHDPALAFTVSDSPFTIEAWIWIESLGDVNTIGTSSYLIQRKGRTNLGDSQMDYGVLAQAGGRADRSPASCGKPIANATGREIAFEFGDYANGDTTDRESFTTIVSELQLEPGDEGKWHFIAVAYNGVSSVRFTLDGRHETLSCLLGFANLPPEATEPRSITIGAKPDDMGNMERHLDGRIDELRISDVFLDEHELLFVGEALYDTYPSLWTSGLSVGNGTPDVQDATGFSVFGGSYSLDSIRINSSVTAGDRLIARVWGNSPQNFPGALLEEIEIPPHPDSLSQGTTIFSQGQTYLCEGEIYWISLSANDAVTSGIWRDSLIALGPYHALAYDIGTQNLNWFSPPGGVLQNSLTVTGEPLPDRCKIRWLGGTGNWSDGSRWTLGRPPNSLPYDYQVLIDDGNAIVSSVTVDQNATVRGLLLDSEDDISILNGLTLTTGSSGSGSNLSNDGDIFLDSIDSYTNLTLSGPVTYSGTGTFTLSDADGITPRNRINGLTADAELIVPNGVTFSLQGERGNLGGNTLAISNDGVVDINVSNALTIDPSDNGWTNTGILRIRDSAPVTLNAATYNNTGGTIEVLDGAQLNPGSGAIIEGGSLISEGTGSFRPNTGTFRDITNLAQVTIPNSQTLYLEGTLNNENDIFLDSIDSNTNLTLSGPVTYSGTGTLTLSDADGITPRNRINGLTADAELIVPNGVTFSLQGERGNLGGNTLAISNDGVVDINVSNALTIDPSDNGWTNTGILRIRGSAPVTLNAATYNNTGGTIEVLDGAQLNPGSGAIIEGGSLISEGTGSFRPNTGTFRDITNLAQVTIPNSQTLYLEGTLNNENIILLDAIDSNTRIIIQGTVSLAGSGTLDLGDSAVPHTQKRVEGIGTSPLLIVSEDQTVLGQGTFTVPVQMAGILSPGASPGRIHYAQDLTLQPAARLSMEIGGMTPGSEHDWISGAGNLHLDGTLDIEFLDAFEGDVLPTDEITLITSSGSVTGSFGNVTAGGRAFASQVGSFAVYYGPSSPFGSDQVVVTDYQPGAVLELGGLGQGGTVAFFVDGSEVSVATNSGQTPQEVVEALAAAVSAHSGLSPNIIATTEGPRLIVSAPIMQVTILDSGLYDINFPPSVPTLPVWSYFLLIVFFVATGLARILARTPSPDESRE